MIPRLETLTEKRMTKIERHTKPRDNTENPYHDNFIQLKERFDSITNELDELHQEWTKVATLPHLEAEKGGLILREGELLRELNDLLTSAITVMERTLREIP